MINSKVNILVIDDHPDNLRTLSAMLSEHGYRVRKATSGEMALATIQVEQPDLILLDIRMPHMNGYEVCSALKDDARTRDIPIIFLSALSDTVDKVRAFAVGGVDYIIKPFQGDEVLVRIKHQLTIRQQQHDLNEKNRQLQQEIQERKQAQAETQLLLTAIQAVNQASDVQMALHAILREVRQAIAWDYGETWMIQENHTEVCLSQACYNIGDDRLMQFHQLSSTCSATHEIGLLDSVYLYQQSQWIEDIATHRPTLLRAEPALRAGLRAAFAVPVVLQHQGIAILAFFRRSPAPYDAKLVQLVNVVALQLSALMQRKQAEDALRQANQELRRLVNLDGLTQIANRRYFDESLQSEWQRLKREQASLSLILCDVDHFKAYNDCYGHQAGDECLKQIAQVIDHTIRRPADLVARYGGEEFAVILPSTDMEGASHVAQRIQAAIAELKIPHLRSPLNGIVTISMGIAGLVPLQDAGPDALIMAADQALYTAKAQGRNRYHCWYMPPKAC